MGTWIKEIPQNYWEHTSFCFNDIMLWQEENVFIMDNHRSAAWCWLNKCKNAEKYNFIHIDRHYDMGDYYTDEDLGPVRQNSHMEYEEMMNLKRSDGVCETLKWDNYIRYVYELRPDWFKTSLFITHKEGNICKGWNRPQMPIVELDELYILAWLKLYLCKNDKYLQGMSEDSSNLKWIVNLDLDFFYYSDKCVKLQVFSDTYIKEVAKVLQKAMKNIQALTIAISPECLDGRNMKEKWDNGFRILKIMSEELPLLKKFPFPIE